MRLQLELVERGRILLRIAWEVVSQRAGRPLPTDRCVRAAAFLRRDGAVFVSLHRLLGDGRRELRGCLGTVEPMRPLIVDLCGNASAVVDRDSRFAPVCAEELDALELEVTELETLRRLRVRSREELLELLRPGLDGLLVRVGERQAIFLPQVWQRGRVSGEEFLGALLEKAGLPRHFWSTDLELFSYGTRSWRSRWPGRSVPGH